MSVETGTPPEAISKIFPKKEGISKNKESFEILNPEVATNKELKDLEKLGKKITNIVHYASYEMGPGNVMEVAVLKRDREKGMYSTLKTISRNDETMLSPADVGKARIGGRKDIFLIKRAGGKTYQHPSEMKDSIIKVGDTLKIPLEKGKAEIKIN